MVTGKNPLTIVPIFLLGTRPTLRNEDEAGREAETDEILERYGLEKASKRLITKEEELL